jgi:hypothetical protein
MSTQKGRTSNDSAGINKKKKKKEKEKEKENPQCVSGGSTGTHSNYEGKQNMTCELECGVRTH